jgi:hypothetical protein
MKDAVINTNDNSMMARIPLLTSTPPDNNTDWAMPTVTVALYVLLLICL